MRYTPRLQFSPFILITLIIGAALFAASAFTQQSTQERVVWDVQMAPNAQATSTITLQNQCKQTHTFTVTGQETPFLQLLAAATVNLPGNSMYNLPIRFNTNGMQAGQYPGTVVVKCDTCRKEKNCKQDREILPVHLLVLQESGAQMTPGNPTQPQVPGPPITLQEKPGPPKVLPTASADGEGFDEKGNKKSYKAVPFDDRAKPCKTDNCPKLQTTGSGKDTKIFCQHIDLCGGNGEDCKNATCHMLVATVDAKDPGKWEGYTGSTAHGMIESEKSMDGKGKDKATYKKKQIEEIAFKPEKGKAYRCSCY
jgi:hypothetical protein